MDNVPWDARAIINGIWENVSPSNEVLLDALIKEKINKCYISSDDNDNNDIE
jgi:hypothetical protein